MTSLGLVLAFIRECDDERHACGAGMPTGTLPPAEFPAHMPSDSNLGRAMALTRELVAEAGDTRIDVPAQDVTATATQCPHRLGAQATALAAAA